MTFKLLLYLFILFPIWTCHSLQASEVIGETKNYFKIDAIEVEGVKKVEKEAVLEKLNSKEGMVLDNYLLKRDIEKIYAMKYFDFVEAHQKVVEGKNILLFKIKEKPIINKIIFEGNSNIDEDDLKGQVKTKEFAILDVNTIKNDLAAIQKQYEDKGFYLASVEYKLKEVSAENVELVFTIRESQKVKVKKVTFLGNKAFADDQLKDIMETQEDSFFSFMSGTGNFKELNFQTDIERLKYFYKTKGYLLVNVGSPEITVSEDKRWVFITVKVTEGPMFTVNNITFQGEVLFGEDELLEQITLKKEDVYSEENLRKDIQMLTEKYQDEGYAFANVLRNLNVVPGENKVDVEFSFEKGKMAYFGKIIMKGNTKTRDKVIRRELTIREGQKFSGSGLRISKENVDRLGFFEQNSVVFNTVSPKGKDDVLDVEINVKERNTGQISLGAGYSTATGGFLQASIAQNNFRGLGQNLSFSLSLASNNQSYNLGFTEPYLLDSKWTAGADIFKTLSETSESSSYKKEGFDLRVGHPIFDYTRIYFTYKFEDTTITAANDPTIDTDVENGVASSIKTTLIWDKRNNKFETSKGHYLSLGSEYVGVGGDKKWYTSELDGRYFYNIWGDLVLRSRAYASKHEVVDGKPIPRTEKFTLGGSRNLRGYDFQAIGPFNTVNLPAGGTRTFNQGGLFYTFGQFELEHPLAREAGLKWVLFYDVGNVSNKYFGNNGNYELYSDYGFGFRWFSPIGVLRFEFGYPLRQAPNGGGLGSQFYFDLGQNF
jgi:outer membrane protein insertion porin family